MAGLSYEVHPHTGIGLDAAIAEDAASDPGVLPLLSFVLDTLYAEDVARHGGRVLTYASHASIGGLRGAIASRAEATVTSLSPGAQDAIPRVLRALTSVTPESAQGVAARAAPIDRFPPRSALREVVDAMIDARLLIASSEGTITTVRPAHDALLTHWERARRVLADQRRDLETRSMVEQACRQWEAVQRPRSLLLRGLSLAIASDLARRWGDELDPTVRSFIAQSQWRRRWGQWLAAASTTIFQLWR